MKTLIKNGQINTRKNMTTPAEIWIEDGRIKAIGTGFSEAEFDEVFDAKESQDLHTRRRSKLGLAQLLVAVSLLYARCRI